MATTTWARRWRRPRPPARARTTWGDGWRSAQRTAPAPASFAADAAMISEAVLPDLPDDVIARAVTAWPGLFGAVSFELFGQYNNVITDLAAVFDYAVRGLGRHIGFPD